MSKIKLALEVVQGLRNLATSIETIANIVQKNDNPNVSEPKKVEKLTLEQVRAVLTEKSQNGKQLEVKALITSFGATKLTDIDPVKYEELIKMASHAILSASSSHRWLHCSPSARLEEQFENTSSVFAKEGTFMHELSELQLRLYL